MTCLLMNRAEPCANSQCRDYVPPVPGDVLRRHPVCARVLFDEAERVGGMSQPAIGWLLGVSTSFVCRVERDALVKLRTRLEAA